MQCRKNVATTALFSVSYYGIFLPLLHMKSVFNTAYEANILEAISMRKFFELQRIKKT